MDQPSVSHPVNPPVAPENPIEDEASDWLSRRLAGPLTAAEQRAFMAWINRGPEHLAAYRYAESTWQQLEAIGREPGPLHDDIAHLLQRPVRPGYRSAIAACIAIVAVGASLWFGNPLTLMRADYAAAAAQNRDVQLPDGSRVTLAPGAALALDFTASERRVELLGGSAYFTVAPLAADSSGRPFVVRGGNGSTRALGTQFAVDIKPASVVVAVTEHAVEVSAGADKTVVLAGRAVAYAPDGSIAPLEGVDAASTTAWHRGKLIFDRQPVSEIVAELGRYRRGQIVVADRDLAERRISGIFNTDDIDGALAAIARELNARSRLLPFLAVLY
jgi:transmembrane sensor